MLNFIHSFFKSKKASFLIIFIFLLFLLTLLSLNRINQKVAQFIGEKSKAELIHLEKQIGLKVKWEQLHFHILSFKTELRGISLENAQNKASEKNLLFDFLDGTQYIETLFIRPSLFSFIFQKQISLSKVKIISGNINLKVAKRTSAKTHTKKTLNLPIKKIEIKKTNISLEYQNRQILLSNININLKKKRFGRYNFKGVVKQAKIHQEEPFLLKAKGWVSEGKMQLDRLSLQNKKIDVKASSFFALFNSKKILQFKVKTLGQLPFSSFYNLAQLFNKKIPYNDGIFSYDLDLSFDRPTGYKGNFKVESTNFHLRDQSVKLFKASGTINKYLVFIDQGQAQLTDEDSVQFYKAQLNLASPYSFQFSSNIKNLSLPLFIKTFFYQPSFPLNTIYTGSLSCNGNFLFPDFDCNLKSQPLDLQIQNGKNKIVSLYRMIVDAKFRSKKGTFIFKGRGTKNKTTSLDINGKYFFNNRELVLTIDGVTKLKNDIQFHTPISLKGDLRIKDGHIYSTKKNFSIEGLLNTKNLVVDDYKLDRIDSFIEYKKNQISFKKLEGSTGKRSSYKGDVVLDLRKKEVQTEIEFSFVDVQDIIESTKKKIKWPFSISGTGEGSLSLKSSFSNFKQKDFRLKGNLFNSFIEQEGFKVISFDVSALKGAGTVSLLQFQKEKGKIDTQGTFDKNLRLDLKLKGYDIPLERIQTLNRFLPLRQSGIVRFNIDLKGSLYQPEAQIKTTITEANLYTYPIKNSKFLVNINKKGIQLSGNLMNELSITRFFYPFSKKKPVFIKGQLHAFDFIKTVLAHYQKENPQNYLSKLTGNLELTLSRKDFSPINGNLFMKIFYISKGSKWVQNQKSFSVEFKNKGAYLNPVTFYHYNNKKLEIKKQGTDKLFISGYHSLDYWPFLFLFLKNLEGDAQINLVTNRNLKNLQPKGTIKIQKGLLALHLIPVFKNISSLWKIKNNTIFIQNFKSVAGSGSNSGSGQIIYKNPQKAIVNVNLEFQDAYLNIPVGFHTKGKGNVNISGKKFPYLLKGSYLIESGVIKNEFSSSASTNLLNYHSFLEEENEKQKSAFHLDINLKTEKSIEIENSFIHSNIEGGARIHGPLKNLLIDGKFKTAEKGSIIFKEQEFKINSGTILFNNSPPNNPILNLSAQTLFEEKNIDTDFNTTSNTEKVTEYKIFLSAKGPARKMNISLQSQPALSKKEIISLLTLGVNTRYFEEHIKQNVTQYSYHLLGSFFLQQPLSKELRDKFGLNLILSPALNIQTNEPVTKITLKRNWLGRIQTSFSRTLEEFPVSDAQVKYDLNSHFSFTASWLNTAQNILIDDFIDRDRLGLDFEFDYEF